MINKVHFVPIRKAGKPTRWYVYAWRGGPSIMQAIGPNRPTLDREALRLLGQAYESRDAPPPGTLLPLIRSYRASREWNSLAAGTRKTWGSQLNRIEAKWAATPLTVWNDPRMVKHVVKWRDERADTPRGADLGVIVLEQLLEFGRLRTEVTINVAANIPRLYKGGNRQEIIWTDDDIERFCVACIQLDRPHLIDVIQLAACTGLRRQDLVTLTFDEVFDFAVKKRALKRARQRRRFATMPRIPELDTLIEDLRGRTRKPGVNTVLVNSRGLPWEPKGDSLTHRFNEVRDAIGVYHVDEDGTRRAKHLHDVRGTFATKLMTDTQLADKEIGDIMAWSAENVADIRRVYVDDSAVVVAIGERIAEGAVKRSVKQSASSGE